LTAAPASRLFIGLMSGTSLDGVDGVLTDFSTGQLRVLQHLNVPFDPMLRIELLALNTAGPDELHRAALAGNALARAYADVVRGLLSEAGVSPESVTAIGAHGQTVRHRPGEFDGTGYTLQLNQPALLAELTGIAVAADFRSRDVAAGGQGAPLVPAFHQALFGEGGRATGVLNIGGISNLSVLGADGEALGFDCGPGNALMDLWCEQHTGQPYDAQGAWASGGDVLPVLLAALMNEPFLHRAPPKSTGRDLFHQDWLATHLAPLGALDPRDVQATLTEFTAQACALHVQSHAPDTQALLVCGGGALNDDLMRRLSLALPDIEVRSTATAGLPPLQVEASAFAWLAWRLVDGLPGNLAAATGARGPRVLGALYPR
jgi:anhydro-N-acetylmuramic acid kinase